MTEIFKVKNGIRSFFIRTLILTKEIKNKARPAVPQNIRTKVSTLASFKIIRLKASEQSLFTTYILLHLD